MSGGTRLWAAGAAIHIGLDPVFNAVAATSCARHIVAQVAEAVRRGHAALAGAALLWATATAIDVAFVTIGYPVTAAGRGTYVGSAYTADAIARPRTRLPIATTAACRAAAIDIRLAAIKYAIAATGRGHTHQLLARVTNAVCGGRATLAQCARCAVAPAIDVALVESWA